MEFLPLVRPPEDKSHTLMGDQIFAMCQRAFGTSVQVASAKELGGGTFNRTFLITLEDRQVILRIAPPATARQGWDEQWLMRREIQIQPFFAALALLMPRTLLSDFTHQIIDRDYIFQTFLPGDRWDEVEDQFTPEEALRLWEQFGSLTRTIHNTTGTIFGGPYPAPEFSTWSQTILYRLERAAKAMTEAQLDITDLQSVVRLIERQIARLDSYLQPRLLHGDLWLFNILVRRDEAGPAISGILDADRAWWGDPLADWTMFVLAKSAGPETGLFHARFWSAYGQPEQTPDIAFRQAVYEAMHIGTAMAWASRQDDSETVQRGKRELRETLEKLPAL